MRGDEWRPRAEKKKNEIKIMGLSKLSSQPLLRPEVINLFKSRSPYHQSLGFLPQISQSKLRHLSPLPSLHPGEENKLAIRSCFCLLAHPINDNLLGVNDVQADASRMLREFQLTPQKPTLLWQVPLQKAPAFIWAKQSNSGTQRLWKRQPLTQTRHCSEPVAATRGPPGVGS